MDRVIKDRRMPRWAQVALGIVVIIGAILLFWRFSPAKNSQTISTDRVTIATVEKGRFDDFLPLRALVTPLSTVYLDAVEGGRVEKVVTEDGATVKQGELLAVLSNSDLQLNVLGRQADVSREVNSMRSQELALAQTQASDERAVIEAQLAADTAKRLYKAQKPLYESGFVAPKAFRDTEDQYVSAQKNLELLQHTLASNEQLQRKQLAELRASNDSLVHSLDIARNTLQALNVRAPVSGQLTAFTIRVGQSLNRGERLGQIDSAGLNKLTADVDEFYLGRVQIGQTALAQWNGTTYKMKVVKIYPQVHNGTFQIDLYFTSNQPKDLQRGQTLQTKLTLGDPTPAILIPNRAFYNETGGTWIFVVTPDGSEAVKRQVRLGRRNADYIEVLEGLEPGERVLVSPYTGFADKDRLYLRR
jgi:HlyD family secretion protein